MHNIIIILLNVIIMNHIKIINCNLFYIHAVRLVIIVHRLSKRDIYL